MAAGYNPRFAWPIVIDSTCDQFRIDEGGGDLVVDVPDGTYYWRDDGTASDFCLVLKTALELAGALTYTVTVATTGIITISATGAWTLRFAAAHDFAPTLLGVTDADHASAGVTNAVVGTYQVACAWYVQQMIIEDDETTEASAAVVARLENGRNRPVVYGLRYTRNILIDALPTSEVLVANESVPQRSFQRFYRYAMTGGRFELATDSSVPGTYTAYQVTDEGWMRVFPATRTPRTIQRWDVRVPLSLYVA